ncbi:MAG: hypothetical protein WA510_21395 [Acidobacteriaceae bacterium]
MITADKEAGPARAAAGDSRRALVDRVIASSAFSRSERLSNLLAYVCNLALSGRAREINEQKIGEAVFGRSQNYDSSIDGIVRTQASRLRQRLELYFRDEGANEPIRIVIPRGGYVPHFEPRPPASAPSSPTLASPPAAQIETAGKPQAPAAAAQVWGSARLAWTVVALLALTLIALLIHKGASTGRQVSLSPGHPFWSQIFLRGQPTLEVPGDSGMVMWQGLVGRNLDLQEYLRGGYRTTLTPSAKLPPDAVVDLGSRRYTSIVDLEVAKALTQMAASYDSKVDVRYARDVRPNDLKQGNVIFVGAAEANPWVELFEHNMNFVFFNDREHRVFSVLNRQPGGNEPKRWDSGYNDAQHRVYAVVAYLPNLGGNGNALILEGTSMAGTECAWDFVSDDSQLLPFLKKIRRADGTIPHFELVLGTNNMNGSAVKNNVLAWRTSN